MPANSHIFLTGFMGSGKSVLGRKLATLAQRGFADLDAYIELRAERSIARIFEEDGEAVFRQLETQYLEELLDKSEPMVIALGGGTVCFGNNLALVKQSGLLVYLQLKPATLADRLEKSRNKRPLLKGLSGEAMEQRIAELLAQRESFYMQAHVLVNGLNLTPKQLYERILEFEQAHTSS